MSVPSGFEAALNAIGKYSWRSMFGVFVASGVILFFSEKLGIDDWAHSIRGWLIGGFIVSGGILMTYLASGVSPSIKARITDWQTIRLGKRHLNGLTPDEKVICRAFVQSGGNSLRHNPVDGAISTLLLRGILFAPGRPLSNEMLQYRMQRWALEYLKKHPELFQ